MRDGEWVRFVIEFEILDLDRFRQMVEAAVTVSRTEPGTVVYDWYLGESGDRARLYEAYASSEALNAHVRGDVFTDVGPRFADASRVRSVDVFGAAAELTRRDLLGAPTTWWGAPIAAVTAAG